MKTQAYPYKEIAPNTYEIGEFDCASVFVLVGDEKAMVIDTGIGVGDLKGFIRTLTDKPLVLVFTHDHADHIGGAGGFEHAYIHPNDMVDFDKGGGIGLGLEGRRRYVEFIAQRQKGTYPYNLDEDMIEWGPAPALEPLEDEQIIDLGNRKVAVYACPGHTPGSITLLDKNTRTLFLGDACNCNLFLGGGPRGSRRFTSIEKALFYLKRLKSLEPRYDRYFNGHYDFRPLGEPLGKDVLDDAIMACEQIVASTANVEMRAASLPNAPVRPFVTIRRTNIGFNLDGIKD